MICPIMKETCLKGGCAFWSDSGNCAVMVFLLNFEHFANDLKKIKK